MNNQLSDQIMGMARSTAAHFLETYSKKSLQNTHFSLKNESCQIHHSSKELVISRQKKREREDSFAQGIREHFRLAPKLTETLKGKLALGARILKVGGVEKILKKLFNVKKDGEEKLMKASQCYLSTTNGPIAGLLFISSDRLAFCSERSIKIVSPTGKPLRVYYKVSIPLRKIVTVDTSENTKKPSQKYIEVATEDNFEFWFMGFLNHRKTFLCLQQLIIMSQAQ